MALNDYVHKGEFDRRIKLIEEKLRLFKGETDIDELYKELEDKNKYYIDQLIDDVSAGIVSVDTINGMINRSLEIASVTILNSANSYTDDQIGQAQTTIDGTDIKKMINYFVNSYNNFAANTLRFNSVFDTDGQFDGRKLKPLSVETAALSVGTRSQQLSIGGIEFRVIPYLNTIVDDRTVYGYLEVINSKNSQFSFYNDTVLKYGERSISTGIAGFLFHYGFGTDTQPIIYVLKEERIKLYNNTSFYIYAKVSCQSSLYKQVSIDENNYDEYYNRLYIYDSNNSVYIRLASKKYNENISSQTPKDYYKINPSYYEESGQHPAGVSEYLVIDDLTEDMYINDCENLYTKILSSGEITYIQEEKISYVSGTYYIKETENKPKNTSTTESTAEQSYDNGNTDVIAQIFVSNDQLAYNAENNYLIIKLGFISIPTYSTKIATTDPVTYYYQRKVDMTYGSTTIDGRLITTGRIEGNGVYIDLDEGEIGGTINFVGNRDSMSQVLSGLYDSSGSAAAALQSAKEYTNEGLSEKASISDVGFDYYTEVLYYATSTKSTPSQVTSSTTIKNDTTSYNYWNKQIVLNDDSSYYYYTCERTYKKKDNVETFISSTTPVYDVGITTTASALKGTTTIAGGLILTSKIKCGSNNNTAGMMGLSQSDYAFWAGQSEPEVTSGGVTTESPYWVKKDGTAKFGDAYINSSGDFMWTPNWTSLKLYNSTQTDWVTLEFDDTNKALKVKRKNGGQNDGIAGVYSDWISALGANSSGGGGGGGGINWADFWNELNGTYDPSEHYSGSTIIDIDYIPNLSASKITSGTFDAARIPTLSITDKTSGTLPVNRGGTGATSLSGVLVGNGTNAITGKTIMNNTSVGALGWTSASGNGLYIPTLNTLAYWNGAYSGTTSNINYLGTIKQRLILYNESPTGSNYGSGLRFYNKDTTTGQQQDTSYIFAYNTHSSSNYGMNMVIQSAGNIFIGGGESPSSLYSTLTTSTNENLYCTADGTIYLESNADTIANRLGIAINTNGAIVPVKAEAANNNAQNIGASNNKWANVYAVNFDGDLSGNATTATTASKLGTSNVGSTDKPIYLNNGVATVCGVFPTLNTTGEINITDNSDLNTYTAPGMYGTGGGYGGSTTAASLLNKPTFNGGFRMSVQYGGYDNTYIRQIIYCKNGETFSREGYLSNNVWSWFDWLKILNSSNYSSYALPLSGGTMTGTINSQSILPKTTDTYDIGNESYYYSYGCFNVLYPGTNNNLWLCSNAASGNTRGIFFGYGGKTASTTLGKWTYTGLGIGTASPAYKLDVAGDINTSNYVRSIRFLTKASANANYAGLCAGNQITSSLTADDGALYYYGKKLWVWATELRLEGGNIVSTGAVTALVASASDKRLKKEIKPFNAKQIIDKLNPVEFEWNKKANKYNNNLELNKKNYGLIAQDSDGIIDNLVFDLPDGKGYKGVRYEKLIPILLQAVKEQQKEIDELKSIVKQLKNK